MEKWRPRLLALTGLLWLVVGVGRYERASTGFLLVMPFAIAILSLLAALLFWTTASSRSS